MKLLEPGGFLLIPSPIPDPASFLHGLNLNPGYDEGVKAALNPHPTAWRGLGRGLRGTGEDLGVLGVLGERGAEM